MHTLRFPLPTLLLALAASGSAVTAHAVDTPRELSVGGFVDTYYAYDFNRPPTLDRAFTTQPARHNEFNINLAYIEGKVEREKVHGRLALQAGTSVQSNYAGEPTIGSVSGPSLSRHLQEAYAGYRLGNDTWIDAGIMFAHVGAESFISRDNLTYTRSLVADYSPYYETGVRLSTRLSEKWSAQLLVLNGWQNISESNANKAFGTQLSASLSPEWTLTYNTFFGQESGFRHFHDLILKYTPSAPWTLLAQGDFGFQDQAGNHTANWFGFMLTAKRELGPSVAAVARVERYADRDRVLIAASNGHSFQAWGASLGIDTALDKSAWWRNELRALWAESAVFATATGFSKTNTVVVSSIALGL